MKSHDGLSMTQAIRAGLGVVFCPRCGWKLVGGSPSLIRDRCPSCRQFGLDAIEPVVGATP